VKCSLNEYEMRLKQVKYEIRFYIEALKVKS